MILLCLVTVNMALEKHPVYMRLFFLGVTGFWGSWILIGTLLRFITGPRKFLFAKNYLKLPACALDPDLGLHKSIEITTADCGVSYLVPRPRPTYD